MAHPETLRLAEILVSRAGGKRTRGSGYLVSPGWVLTADHVVADAIDVRVWLGAPQRLTPAGRLEADPNQILRVPEADLALIPLPEQAAMLGDVAVGQLDVAATKPVPVVAAGFPLFKLRPAPDDETVDIREVRYATGKIIPAENPKTGTYALTVDVLPAPDPRPNHTPWEGMSGAAVFVPGSGRLIGIVAQHHLEEGFGVLTARALSGLFKTKHIADWRQALPQLVESAEDLAVATPPEENALVVRRAQQAAAAAAPSVLVAREDWVGTLRSFVTGNERWMWLQGDAFAGKTALLAWFALHPGPGVDVAACFLRRTTGDAHAAYALDVLCRQLAAHAGWEHYQPPPHLSQARDDFFDLLVDAAAASADRRGHRLLILIDGLDEDQTAEPGLAVASWLPGSDTLPENARLLVASRTGVTVPVPADHPLVQQICRIEASGAATEIEHIAEAELEHARRAHGLVYQLLGLLTAAPEGLTVSGLAQLVRQEQQVTELEVSDTLGQSLGRIAPRIRHPDGLDETVAVFAHAALLDRARADFAADLARLHARVVQWCHSWVERDGDAASVPHYVSHHYADQLAALAEWTDCWHDVLRPSWARVREADPIRYQPHRSDLDTLLRASQRANATAVAAGRQGPALAEAVAALAAKSALESQFQATSPQFVAAMVDTGRWSDARAIGYLASIDNVELRARAIGTVAPVLHPSASGDILSLYRNLEGSMHDERGLAALGVSRLLVAAGRTPDASALAASEANEDRADEACHAAVGALGGLSDSQAAETFSLIREWSRSFGGSDLMGFARRLVASLTMEQAARVAPSGNPGLFVFDVLRAPRGDPMNDAAALRIAARWMDTDAVDQRCEVLLHSVVGKFGEDNVLIELAGIASPRLHQRLLSRAEELDDGNNFGVLAGLLCTDDGTLDAMLVSRLSPRLAPMETLTMDDRCAALEDLARSGHGSIALTYLETAVLRASSYERDRYIEVVVRYLDIAQLEQLRDTVARYPMADGNAMGDICGWIIRRSVDPTLTRIVEAPPLIPAERLARFVIRPPSTEEAVSVSSLRLSGSWRTVATLIGAQNGTIRVGEALSDLADQSLSPLTVSLLPEMIGLFPLGPYDPGAVLDFAQSKGTRVIRAAVEAIAATNDGLETLSRILFTRGSAVLDSQILSVCALRHDQNLSVSELMLGADTEDEKVMRQVAVLGLDAADLVTAVVEPRALRWGRRHELDILGTLPPEVRPTVIDRLLGDSFLTGSQIHSMDWETEASEGLTPLVASLDARQLTLVESGMAAHAAGSSGLSGTTASRLRAEVALRWAHLGEFDAFGTALNLVGRTEDVARALAATVLHVPPDRLAEWQDLVERRVPPTWLLERAVIWAFAHQRLQALDAPLAWTLVDRWVSRGPTGRWPVFDKPWQVLTDLACYTPGLATIGGPGAGQQLYDLLTSSGLLSAQSAFV